MSPDAEIDIDNILMNAVAWAKQAGKIQLELFRKPDILNISAKLNDSDVVTNADRASEALILNNIHSLFGNSHSILSEESGVESNDSNFCWVIDPLDGTTNYSSGLPIFCVSIALKYKEDTILGVVYAPYLDELYTAIKGEGAWLNGEPIKVSSNCEISKAVVSTGFPVDKNVNRDNNLDNVARVLPLVRGMRRLGSAAWDICAVAAGSLDAYWEMNLHEWDVCAAALIAREAGAVVKSFRSDRNVSILVASPGVSDTIFPLLH
ncbi:MAG: inositol monophosphatase [Muribaculaceae bacterium]|nr:inositol monophosphatase [Muribaculaceae bacterium]